MDSSRGFASVLRDRRPIQACFHYGSGCDCLNRATRDNSPDHTPKGTRSGTSGPPTAWKHTISGSVSLPSPGCFSPFPHGTVRYRSLRVACLGLWSAQLQTRFFVPGPTQEHNPIQERTPTGLSPALVRRSRPLQLSRYEQVRLARGACRVLQPPGRNGWRLTRSGFRPHPVRSPLLRVSFSLPPATEMFQLAGCPPSLGTVPPKR